MVSLPVLIAVALGCLAVGVFAGSRARHRIVPREDRRSLGCEDGIPAEGQAAAHEPGKTKNSELAGGLPVPTYEMIQVVTPSFDIETFLRTGGEALEFLCNMLRSHGVALESLRAVLDLGCGCGRILRHFPKLALKNLKVYGSDYNPYLIDWCRHNLGFAEFDVNNLEPPLKYDDESFDFVYAVSVFTHLTEPLQFAWLDELKRILRPRGCLAITVHGFGFLADLSEAQQQQFRSGQLVVKNPEDAGKNSCGTYHPLQYIQEKFTYAFEILEAAQQTHRGWQDTYLLRKKD
jgi:SAM-dependent methyltransferase